jgi:hypothetical protein
VESLESRLLFTTVTVDTSQAFQTIGGIGGNYAKGRLTGTVSPNDTVGQYTLDNLSPGHTRIGIPLKGWEPVNDNADPAVANFDAGTGTAFVNSGTVANVFLLMQDLSRRGLPITVSIWNAPDWMVTNPANTNQRTVPSSRWSELVESFTTFVTTARDVYGVNTIDSISFNESDGGYNLLFNAADHASIIKLAGARFASAGLDNIKWLVGDTAQPAGLYNYASAILSDPDVRPYLGAISYHSWNALNTTDATFAAIYGLAQQHGKEVWCEEVGYDSQLHLTPSTFTTWTYATRLAQTYQKVLALSHASVADYWEYQDDYPLVNASTLQPNPAFYVVRELAEGLRPGAQIVSATSDDANVLAVAGRHDANGTFMLQLINKSTTARQVTVNGLPDAEMALVRSSAAERIVLAGNYTPAAGTLTITLAADSVSTLKGGLQPATATPVAPAGLTTSAATISSVNIRWLDLSGNETGFQIEHSTDGVSFSPYATAPANATNYTVTGLPAGVVNHFRVRAANDAGSSAYTAAAGVTMLATPQGLTAQAVSDTQINLGWQSVENATRYVVQRTSDLTTGVWTNIATTGGTVYANTALAPGTPYFYRVQAIGIGSQSGYSTAAGATTTVNGRQAYGFSTATTTYVRDGKYAKNNFGAAADLVVRKGNGNGNTYESYLKFDVSALPASASQVGLVKLRLFGKLSDTGTASLALSVYSAANTSWTESSVTWNTKPASGTAVLASATIAGTTGKWYEIDLTNFLKAELAAGRKIVTLVLKSIKSTSTSMVFNSDDAATNRPTLNVYA